MSCWTPINLKGLLKGDVDINKVKGFIFNPDKRSAAEIKKTYEILNKTDPDAFPTLARIYIESQANKAFVLKEAGESAKTGFNLYKRLIGDDASKANFNSVLRGVAEAKGINPNELILGWNNFNEVLNKASIKIITQDSVNMVYESLSTRGSTVLFNMKYFRKNKVINQMNELLHNKQVGYIEYNKMVKGLNKIKSHMQNPHHEVFAEVEKLVYKIKNKLNLSWR